MIASPSSRTAAPRWAAPLGYEFAAQLLGFALGISTLLFSPPTARAEDGVDIDSLVVLLELVIDFDPDSASKSLAIITSKVQQRELGEQAIANLKTRLSDRLEKIVRAPEPTPLQTQAVALSASFGNRPAQTICRSIVLDSKRSDAERLAAVNTLIFVRDRELLPPIAALVSNAAEVSIELREQILAALGRWDEPQVAGPLISSYEKLEPTLRPRVIELLTQRTSWSKALLVAISDNRIPASALNANHVTRLLASKDEQLVKLVRDKWGTVRSERNPQREQTIARVREKLQSERGDPHRGQLVFEKLCGQCHKIHGKGQDVGPDITSNGRAAFEQLLSNVLDPSLVIGASYQARMIATEDGRVLTGLPVEDSPQRVVLKVQGGKLETVPREEIETYKISDLSLMPEGLENQLPPQELLDLFAFLLLDKPPSDPTARLIPGTPAVQAGPSTAQPHQPGSP